MDTLASTSNEDLSHLQTPIQAIQTTGVVSESLKPGNNDWFTRFISPLTRSSGSSSSRSSSSGSTLSLAQSAHHPGSTSSTIDVEVLVRLESVAADADALWIEPSHRTLLENDPFDHDPFDRAVVAMQEGYSTLPAQRIALDDGRQGVSTLLLVFLPILVVVLTVLIGLICFLVAVLLMKRRKGVHLTEDGGPLDLSKGDGVIGEGGVEGVESRWLETVEPDVKEAYRRAKEWQEHYPPSSVPTDITLSQFLSIQEKGVSAWCFEPDYEDNLSLYVQSRTEITFLSDGPGMPAREGGGNSVMANLPLPKLNEVYYWEVKMYEKSPTTEVAVGLATKPYPSFRLPGWNRHSVAYFASDGFKSHNYPFTASSYGPPLNEGDVLGVGYRPRTGTVFFTRNGRKMDDAYTGLQRLNLFPTVGANGPCTLHVNLGQAGFVFIEANVKKWGLAPMVGTLAPPPAYGSERGSILLDAGYGTPGAAAGTGSLLEAARARYATQASGMASPGRSSNSSRRHRRAGRSANLGKLSTSVPGVPSPLRASEAGPGPTTAGSRRRVLGRIATGSPPYVSPTDTPEPGPRPPSVDVLENLVSDGEAESTYDSAEGDSGSDAPSSATDSNLLTPGPSDYRMQYLVHPNSPYFDERQQDDDDTATGSGSGGSSETARPPHHGIAGPPPTGDDSPPPPGYAPVDPNVYAGGLPADIPEEMVNQAIAATMPAADAEPRPAADGSGSGRIGRLLGFLG